jgi:hypothetical protein
MKTWRQFLMKRGDTLDGQEIRTCDWAEGVVKGIHTIVYEAGYLITSTFSKVEELPIISPKLVHVLRRTSDMTLDSLKQSLDEQSAELVSARIIDHNNKKGLELSARATATEAQIIERLQAQQPALDELIKAVAEVTANPTGSVRGGGGSVAGTPNRPSARL